MDENDPRLIVTLKTINSTIERAFKLLHNRERCSFVFNDAEDAKIPSRETTPLPGQCGSQIQLTFDKKPKNLEKGFVFGFDHNTCDVVLDA